MAKMVRKVSFKGDITCETESETPSIRFLLRGILAATDNVVSWTLQFYIPVGTLLHAGCYNFVSRVL